MLHIHIKDASSKGWNLKKISYNKTSDTALIYCEGFFKKDHFLLLGFLENAHQAYRLKLLYLSQLADVAESLRARF